MTFTHLAIAHSPLSPSNPISQVNSVMLDFFLYAQYLMNVIIYWLHYFTMQHSQAIKYKIYYLTDYSHQVLLFN